MGGILEAYAAALRDVELAGPTLFSEVLQTAMARANRPANQMDQRYDVLLILTDGIINDMRQVRQTHVLFVDVFVCLFARFVFSFVGYVPVPSVTQVGRSFTRSMCRQRGRRCAAFDAL